MRRKEDKEQRRSTQPVTQRGPGGSSTEGVVCSQGRPHLKPLPQEHTSAPQSASLWVLEARLALRQWSCPRVGKAGILRAFLLGTVTHWCQAAG